MAAKFISIITRQLRCRCTSLLVGILLSTIACAKPLTGTGTANEISGGAFMEDCDWIGMTKDSVISQKSIQQEYLRCSSGHVKWLNPEGAVQIALHTPRNFNFPAENLSEFSNPKKLCLTFNPNSSKQVQLYIQKGHQLQLVHSVGKSGDEVRKCFDVENNVVRLFLEKSLINSAELAKRNRRELGKSANLVRLPSTGAAEFTYDFQ